jgi:hypothetical protein
MMSREAALVREVTASKFEQHIGYLLVFVTHLNAYWENIETVS